MVTFPCGISWSSSQAKQLSARQTICAGRTLVQVSLTCGGFAPLLPQPFCLYNEQKWHSPTTNTKHKASLMLMRHLKAAPYLDISLQPLLVTHSQPN